MAIQKWSENITVVELVDDPDFTDDLTNLSEDLQQTPADVVMNFAAVSFVNSSNVAGLLRLRKQLIKDNRRLILSGLNPHVWGVFQVTGLEKVFENTNDISTAKATLQLLAEEK